MRKRLQCSSEDNDQQHDLQQFFSPPISAPEPPDRTETLLSCRASVQLSKYGYASLRSDEYLPIRDHGRNELVSRTELVP